MVPNIEMAAIVLNIETTIDLTEVLTGMALGNITDMAEVKVCHRALTSGRFHSQLCPRVATLAAMKRWPTQRSTIFLFGATNCPQSE